MHRPSARCQVLLAPVLGVLLVLAGLATSEGGGPGASPVPGLRVSSAVAPAVASSSSGPGVRTTGRPATGRPVIDTGPHPAVPVAGRITPLVERAAPEQHGTPPGLGDLTIGPAAGVQAVPTAAPAFPEDIAATPPSAPSTAIGARAPPVS
ncbi:hypothetical protein [Geodermatophilus sp. URMC 60]